jgi:hypothetical protein
VSTQEGFATVCRDVCQERGWELLPIGIRVPLPAGRSQLVELDFFESGERPLVRLTTRIGGEHEVSKVRIPLALRLNAELAHGAFALRDGELVMLDTLLLEDTDPGELEAVVDYLAHTADRYEDRLFGRDEH